MVRIRPRGDGEPATVAGRPLEGEHVPPPSPEEIAEVDDLAGAEAFGPRPDADADFATFAGGARRVEPRRGASAASIGLLVAIVVLVAGLLSVVLGLADDDDPASDDVATVVSTTSTTAGATSTSSTVRSSTTTAVGSSTSTTSGFTPGSTPTTVRPTVTTLRPSTTLPTATTLAPNRALTVSVDVVAVDGGSSDVIADQPTEITVRLADPDAVPSGNCLEVVVEGGMGDVVLAENSCDTGCPDGSATSDPIGGTFTNTFNHTFDEAGTYLVVVTATSGRPGCGNRYADRVDDVRSSPITVATAD